MRKLDLEEPSADDHLQMFALSVADLNSHIFRASEQYLPISSHSLPFPDFTFDFALSAHYLFSDSDEHDVDSHLQAIRELARVAKEVRIFPLINNEGQPSPFLGPVLLGLQQDDYGVEVCEVKALKQSKANAMLRVWAKQCQVD